MEQMIWLAPWVLTELWISTLTALMPRCCYTGQECDAPSSRRQSLQRLHYPRPYKEYSDDRACQ
jgi:hypothetical protein